MHLHGFVEMDRERYVGDIGNRLVVVDVQLDAGIFLGNLDVLVIRNSIPGPPIASPERSPGRLIGTVAFSVGGRGIQAAHHLEVVEVNGSEPNAGVDHHPTRARTHSRPIIVIPC